MEKLDKYRGNISREEFLEKLLSDFASSTEEDTSKSSIQEQSADSKNFELILSKLDKVDELNSKIAELEEKHTQLEKSMKDKPSSEKPAKESTVETKKGDTIKTFMFPGEDVEPDIPIESTESALEVEEYDEEEIEDEETYMDSNYEFIYGCLNCDKSVEESDTVCPFCGFELEDVPGSVNWLEKVGEHEEEYYPDDYMEGDYYDEPEYYQEDVYDDDYDPSPRHYPPDNRGMHQYQGPKDVGFSHYDPVDRAGPPCQSCGGETEYVEQYDRWYCYDCSEYLPRQKQPTSEEAERMRQNRSQVIDRIMSRRRVESKSGPIRSDKPLQHYGPYGPSEAITRISLIDSDKSNRRTKR